MRAPLRLGRAARPVPRAQAARPPGRDRAARLGPRPPGAADHQAVLRPLHAGDLGPRLRAALRRARPRARLPRRAAPVSARSPGRFCIVLHTHMPYVEGYGTWPFGEEWLWEAMATSYLPLLDVLDAAPGRVTLSLTPVLCDQLEARRGGRALPRLPARRAAPRPTAATSRRPRTRRSRASSSAPPGSTPRPPSASRRAAATSCGAFAPHAAWTSAATHAVLPLLATTAGLRLQLETGIAAHRAALRRLARRAVAARVRATRRGSTRSSRRPACTPPASTSPTCSGYGAAGPAAPAAHRRGAAARPDRPGDHGPRLAHERLSLARRLPQHAPLHRAPPHAVGGRRRPLRPRARGGAGARRRGALRRPGRRAGIERGGLCVCALDTELLGHFWHEGVDWLAAVIEACDARRRRARRARRRARRGRSRPRRRRPACRRRAGATRATSARGAGRRRRSSRGAREPPSCGCSAATAPRRPGRRALRELLALQASDWAFGVTRETAGPYPRARADGHAAELERALANPVRDEPLEPQPCTIARPVSPLTSG